MVVGLTGGIGSGKSTVLAIFKSLGIAVYQADIIAKELMNSSLEIKNKIIRLLGDDAYQNKVLNKKHVAKKVFGNKALLNGLNSIVHPAVHKHFIDFVHKNKDAYLVYENAILFENKSEKMCDKIIVVAAPLEDRMDRVVKRDGVDRQAVLSRMKHQWNQEEKISKADFVIENNQDIAFLKTQVHKIHQQLMAGD